MSGGILVLDLGTTNFKACLFSDEGQLIAVERERTPLVRLEGHRCEMQPEAFRRAVGQVIGRLKRRCPEQVDAIGAFTFSTQTNSFLLLSRDDAPVTPIIAWPDERSQEEAQRLAEEIPAQELALVTGMPGLGPQPAPAKLLWLAHHEPECWRTARRFCLISDYLTLWLSGEHVTEAGAASFTGMVDIHTCRWWSRMVGRLDLSALELPRIVRAGTDLGPLRAEAARELGFPPACRFIVGGFDQHVGALGSGNEAPGGASETTGTVLVAARCADCIEQVGPGIYQQPGHREGLYYRLAVSEASGNLLEWYQRHFAPALGFKELDALAEAAAAGAEGLGFNPNPYPRTLEDVLPNISSRHGAGHAVRRIMEGVADELGGLVARLWPLEKPQVICAAGGGSRSRLWLQIKADRLGIPFATANCEEPTSRGAAMLAARTLGLAEEPWRTRLSVCRPASGCSR